MGSVTVKVVVQLLEWLDASLVTPISCHFETWEVNWIADDTRVKDSEPGPN